MSQQRKRRQHRAAGQFSASAVEDELDRISGMAIDDLRNAWIERFGNDVPSIRSRDVLLRLFAWRIQADAFGGLDAATERKLRAIANALERDGDYELKVRRDLAPGIVLTREWKGATHKVTVVADGFQYSDTRYRSLSDIARTITGTRWSGPRFFGLEQKAGRVARKQAS